MLKLLFKIILAAIFLFAGFNKVIASDQMVELFTGWGFGLWFMYLTGALEIILAIGLLLPKRASRSAFLLSIMMVVAVIIHLNNNENILPPLVLAAVTYFASLKFKNKS